MSGVELTELPLDRLLNVITSMATDDRVVTATAEIEEGRLRLWCRDAARASLATPPADGPSRGPAWSPATWGVLPEHQAAQRAAMSFVGVPAAPLAQPDSGPP